MRNSAHVSFSTGRNVTQFNDHSYLGRLFSSLPNGKTTFPFPFVNTYVTQSQSVEIVKYLQGRKVTAGKNRKGVEKGSKGLLREAGEKSNEGRQVG